MDNQLAKHCTPVMHQHLYAAKICVVLYIISLPFLSQIKVLNDSKEITATLYLSSLILATVIIITLAFDDYLNVYAGAFCYGIAVSSMVVLGVVFLSKVSIPSSPLPFSPLSFPPLPSPPPLSLPLPFLPLPSPLPITNIVGVVIMLWLKPPPPPISCRGLSREGGSPPPIAQLPPIKY